jgi:hypothetical protein
MCVHALYVFVCDVWYVCVRVYRIDNPLAVTASILWVVMPAIVVCVCDVWCVMCDVCDVVYVYLIDNPSKQFQSVHARNSWKQIRENSKK